MGKTKPVQQEHSFVWKTHCCYCRRQFSKTIPALKKTDDHFYPVSRGGLNVENNVLPCCFECNQWKRDRMPADFLKIIERAYNKNGRIGTYTKRDLAQIIGSLRHFITFKKGQIISIYKL